MGCQRHRHRSLLGALGTASSSNSWNGCEGLPLEKAFCLQPLCQGTAFVEVQYCSLCCVWADLVSSGPPFSVPMCYFKQLSQICQLRQHPKGSYETCNQCKGKRAQMKLPALCLPGHGCQQSSRARQRAGSSAGSSERLLLYLQAYLLAGIALARL